MVTCSLDCNKNSRQQLFRSMLLLGINSLVPGWNFKIQANASVNRPIRLTQCCTQVKSSVLFPKGLNWVQHWVSRIGLFHLRPAIPPLLPRLLRGICPPCQSREWGICKFCTAQGPGICQPWGHSRAFNTHAISYQNITTQTGLLEKKADWLICQGQE